MSASLMRPGLACLFGFLLTVPLFAAPSAARELLSVPFDAPLRANVPSGDFRTKDLAFPKEHGRLVLTVRLRAASGGAKMNVHLIGDNYNWRETKEVDLSPVVQTVTVAREMPRTIRKRNVFFARLDPPKGVEVLVESFKVAWEPLAEVAADERERLVNADFSGGAWGFLRYFSRRSSADRPARAAVVGGRARPGRTCWRSFAYPIVPGRVYTVAARVRNLQPAEPAEVILMLVDNAWQIASKRVRLADGDWHDLRFTCTMKPSLYNRAYVRLDTRTGTGVEVERISLADGERADFPPFVDGEIVPGGPTLFDAGRPGVFRVRRRNAAGLPGKAALEVRDLRGRVMARREFAYGAEPFADIPLEIPASHPRGLFEVVAPGVPRLRYAVMEDLSSAHYSFNPHAGHYYPHDFMDLTRYHRYMPVTGGGNRAFCFAPSYPRNPKYLAALDAMGFASILTMPEFETFNCNGECPWTDEVKRAYWAQGVEMAKLFRGHRVAGVELFNEPFLWRLKKGPEAGRKTMRGSKVAQIHAETVPLLKAANPELKVVGPCCALKELGYLEEFLKAGGGAYLDAVSVHSYAADPDTDDFAGLYRELRAMVKRHLGRELPVYNTEAYFGVRNSPCTLSDGEAQRGYFRESEWSHAGVVVAQVVNHAAAQVAWCNFGPECILSGLPESEQPYPYAALPALNAAIGLLADGGPGEEIALMPGLRCFLFAGARGGPLATLRSRIDAPVRVSGLGGVGVKDVFGNQLAGDELTLHDEVVYLRFGTAGEARTRLAGLRFAGLEEVVARERPLTVKAVRAAYSAELSLDGAETVRLAGESLSQVHTPGLAWRGEEDLSADLRLVWNEKGLRLGVAVRDDRAVYPESGENAYRADSLQVYFDQRNDATPASEEAGKRREDDIVYNIAALDGGRRPTAYVSFANGSRYLGAANETTGVDSEVKVEYARKGEYHVYKVFFPAEVFPDFKLKAGARIGFSLAVNDADAPRRRGQSLVLSSPGAEPYLHAHEYLDLEFSE